MDQFIADLGRLHGWQYMGSEGSKTGRVENPSRQAPLMYFQAPLKKLLKQVEANCWKLRDSALKGDKPQKARKWAERAAYYGACGAGLPDSAQEKELLAQLNADVRAHLAPAILNLFNRKGLPGNASFVTVFAMVHKEKQKTWVHLALLAFARALNGKVQRAFPAVERGFARKRVQV